MPDFAQLFRDLGDRIRHGERQLPTAVQIPNDHVQGGEKLNAAFARDEQYFQVRVNEMYLGDARQWFSTIDPVVFVVSEFTYAGKMQAVPFLVGPELIEKFGQKTANGTLFRNTRVAGLHPYRGGRVNLSVVLCQIERENYARKLLNIVGSMSQALDFATMLVPYIKIGNVIAEGFESLLDSKGTQPLIALRDEYDPDADKAFTPGYFVLIDKSNVSPQSLWVRDQQLFKGTSFADAAEYRDADYVLYSIVRPTDNKRSDIELLPFNEVWQRVLKEAAVPKDENWVSAKANMASLYQTLLLSPDLTSAHADWLTDEYAKRMQQVHQRAVNLGGLGNLSAGEKGVAPETDPALDRARNRSLQILQD